jgi:hypothetical protein
MPANDNKRDGKNTSTKPMKSEAYVIARMSKNM